MPDLGLQSFNKLYPMMIRKYNDLIIDQNATEADKINQIIQKLNALGKLSNDVVRDWNTVYGWAMNDGLTTDVNNKLELMLANHEFDPIMNNILTKIGDLTTLNTADKDTLVHAINDNVASLAQKANQTSVDDISINVKTLGADSTGVTDATTIVQNAVNSLLNTGGTIYFPKGTYKINGSITGAFNNNINIVADAGTVIDGTGSTATTLLTIGGSKGATSSPLTASPNRGQKTISCALSVNPNDILLVTSTDLFNSTRSYYYKGELVEVESSSAGVITLKSGLYDSYNSATTVVYKITAPKVCISNLNIKRNGNYIGLMVQYAKDISLQDISVTGARQAGIQVGFYVYGGTVRNCYATDFWYSGSSLSYGLVIDSSQSITVVGGRYLGGRHGIAHGGNEPTRDITILSVTVGNFSDGTVVTPALDFHGNCDYVNVRDCTILNGAELAGSCRFVNNKVYATNGITYGVQWYGERNAEYVDISENFIKADILTTTNGVLIQANISGITINRLNVSSNDIYASYSGILIRNQTTSYTGFIIKSASLRHNYVISSGTGFNFPLFIISSATSTLEIDSLSVIGGTYNSINYRPVNVTLVETGTMKFDGVTFTQGITNDYLVEILDGGNAIFTKCNFNGNATSPYSAYSVFGNAGTLQLIDNTFANFKSNGGILYNGTSPALNKPSMVTMKGNIFTNVVGKPLAGTVQTISDTNANGNNVSFGTAIPTTGTWNTGDIIYNTTPSLSGSAGSQYVVLGWMCTAGGTPGTWQPLRCTTGT